jgi:chloramphenicol O-acetyltransferase
MGNLGGEDDGQQTIKDGLWMRIVCVDFTPIREKIRSRSFIMLVWLSAWHVNKSTEQLFRIYQHLWIEADQVNMFYPRWI